MAEEIFKVKFEVEGREDLAALLETQEKLVDGFGDIEEAQKDAFKGAEASNKNLGKSLTNNLGKLDQNKVKLAENKREAKGLGDTFKGAAKEVTLFGVNIGDVTNKLSNGISSLSGFVKGIKNGTGALRLFKVALASTGIGAIVIALGSLVTLLTKTQKGIDFTNRVMAGLGATVDVLIDRFAKFGSGVVKLFSGDMKGAVEDFKGAVTGIGEEIRNEAAAAAALEQRAQNLRDATREIGIEEAKRRSEVERLRNLAADETKSYSERTKAAQRAFNLEDEIAKKREEAARENLAIIQQRNSLGESLAGDLEAEAQAEIELLNIAGERERRQREILSLQRTISRQAAAEAEQQKQRQQEIINVIAGANATLGGSVAEIELKYASLRKELERTKEEAQQLGLNLDFTPVETLLAAQEKRAKDAAKGIVEPLQSGLKEGLKVVSDSTKTDFEKLGQDAIENFSVGAKKQTEDITPELREFLTNNVVSIFNSVNELIALGFESQLNKQREVISALEQETSEIEAQLQEQVRLQEEGRANNRASLEKDLQEQNKLLAKAQADEQKIKKKAAKQQLIIDSALQASQLALATAQILANSAQLGPFAYFAAAAAGVAFLFATVARAKAQAQQASTPQGLKEGTEFVDGPGTKTSDSIPAKLSRGERVLDAFKNEQIGGRQLTNDELVQYVQMGKMYEAFFGNAPMIPLPSLVNQMDQNQTNIIKQQQQNHWQALTDAYRTAAAQTTKELIGYWKTRPIDTPLNQPIKREYQEGSTKRVKIIRPV